MELVAALLYIAIAVLMWRLSDGWIRENFRVVAALFWPLTLLAWVAAALLVFPACLLVLTGYLDTCRRERHPGNLSLS